MTTRGRPPKPSALKLLQGNAGKRATNRQEPDAAYLEDLTPPAHLSEGAAAVWTELAAPLRAARVLTELDTVALEFTCNAIATYRQATAAADGKPLAKSPETGAVALSPWMIVQSMAFKQASKMLTDFGMTPAARSRVMIQPQGDLFDDKTSAYFA